jgi:hypothetical protein
MSDSIVRQITGLQQLSPTELNHRWRQLFGTEPPAYNRRFLIRRLSYRLQELHYGGLSETARTQMGSIAEDAGWDEIASLPGRGRRPQPRSEALPVIGTRLIREWQGKRYEVTIIAGGFEYDGKPYRSLSAITKAITGTHWNGRSFFGLRRTHRERQR